MNDFDHRWKIAAAAARSAPEQRDDTAPFGFATRVAAQAFTKAPATDSLIWQRLGLRVFSAMTLVLLALAAVNAFVGNDGDSLQPPVEDTVAETFWIL